MRPNCAARAFSTKLNRELTLYCVRVRKLAATGAANSQTLGAGEIAAVRSEWLNCSHSTRRRRLAGSCWQIRNLISVTYSGGCVPASFCNKKRARLKYGTILAAWEWKLSYCINQFRLPRSLWEKSSGCLKHRESAQGAAWTPKAPCALSYSTCASLLSDKFLNKSFARR